MDARKQLMRIREMKENGGKVRISRTPRKATLERQLEEARLAQTQAAAAPGREPSKSHSRSSRSSQSHGHKLQSLAETTPPKSRSVCPPLQVCQHAEPPQLALHQQKDDEGPEDEDESDVCSSSDSEFTLEQSESEFESEWELEV